MYKLTFTTHGTEHTSYYNDLSDAQEAAQNARIHLNAEDTWITRED